ncbi:MAG TPA: hypothetical protein VH307_31210 [Streptosporangiaceae bacterium]|jgi:hypothetical protein|nr:hypothetical protein [Streptosporangiaceae bacterium]
MFDSALTVEFVAAEDVADEIVKRLASNELPEDVARFVRGSAGSMHIANILYAGPETLQMYSRANADGSLWLELRDSAGLPVWNTTLRPPQKREKPAVQTLRYIPVDDDEDEVNECHPF